MGQTRGGCVVGTIRRPLMLTGSSMRNELWERWNSVCNIAPCLVYEYSSARLGRYDFLYEIPIQAYSCSFVQFGFWEGSGDDRENLIVVDCAG